MSVLKLILLGAPGVGKGTQAARICKRYGIEHISTGDILREELSRGTPLGAKAREIMERGDLVPDEIVLELVRERIENAASGFLLDGFPRTLAQAEGLEELGADVNCVVEIEVADEVVVERLGGRRIHPASGRVYHLLHKPPMREGVDDETGEPLIQRPDDTAEVVAERLRVHREQTKPLNKYYADKVKYFTVDGAAPPEEVSETICAHLDDAPDYARFTDKIVNMAKSRLRKKKAAEPTLQPPYARKASSRSPMDKDS